MRKKLGYSMLACSFILIGCSQVKLDETHEQVNEKIVEVDENITRDSGLEFEIEGSKNEELPANLVDEVSQEDMYPGVIEIKEKMFLTQINDIFNNFSDYEGKYIKVEGLYNFGQSWYGDDVHVVFRLGPGCCGNDGWGGFTLDYDGEYPEPYDWVEVIGIPEFKDINGFLFLYLNVVELNVTNNYGAISVEQ